MKNRLLVFLACVCTPLVCYGHIDSLLRALERTIEMRPATLQQKYQRIQVQRDQLSRTQNHTDSFQIILTLIFEYQSFNYDTASIEVQRLKHIAATRNEKVQAEIHEAFILLSSGLFRESIDKLNGLSLENTPDSTKRMYYFNLARSYFDLSDTYTDYLSNEKQFKSGLQYLDSAIVYSPIHSVEHLSYLGLKALKLGEREKGKGIYWQLIAHPAITNRQLAIEYSSLSALYQGEYPDSVLIFMIKAAIADEQALVKESIALTFLARHFFEAKDFERAGRYITLALADANFFGAQYRKMQILNILPLIEKQRLEIEKSKFRQFVFFSVVLGILLLISILLIIRTQRQKAYINEQNRRISEQNQQLTESETAIMEAYKKLERYAQKLSESDRLKEKYIGHFFESNTNLINKVNTLFRKSLKQVQEGKFKEAIFTLKQFNDEYEQKKLLQDFDSTFLTVFPTFIEQFNRFFPETEQFHGIGENTLTLELRIFALIRLGISNNQTIAEIHDYSVNTIYTYKTKIRNKSLLSSEEFDKAVLRIKSIWDGQA